jgi:predicted DNA-binding transcriptional regulator AlpA
LNYSFDIEYPYFNRREVLTKLGVSSSTLQRWINTGSFPDWIAINKQRACVWHIEDVMEWLIERADLLAFTNKAVPSC